MVQKGKFSAGIDNFVTMLKKVDLPTLGNPTCTRQQSANVISPCITTATKEQLMCNQEERTIMNHEIRDCREDIRASTLTHHKSTSKVPQSQLVRHVELLLE